MAKASGPNNDGTQVVPEVDLEVGMNFDQWSRDRAGFRTSEAMVTGGVTCMFGDFAGPEVGWNYQGGLGEERNEPTYPSSNPVFGVPNPPGSLSASGSVSPGRYGEKGSTQFGGKKTLRAPQNYRTYSK